ncbi:hypothetical protein BKA70DRAFT_1240101 [Coprinopsis sp. MPI-PUGE-AT-0042]|nr:hypothetical protein BKA70DRAFT_1240101 [Coprinopsis sp. MPI-PUGE-AT-0042]
MTFSSHCAVPAHKSTPPHLYILFHFVPSMTSEVQPLPTLRESSNNVQMLSVQSTPQFDNNENLAAIIAEFMGSGPMHLFQPHGPPELEAEAQLELRTPLVQPFASMGSNLPASSPENEARLKEMQSTIDAQNRQLLELQSLVRSSQEQCAHFKERAIIFKALYSQQQGISERTMATLVQL